MMRRARIGLTVAVAAIAVLVLLGVGQGHPGPQLPVSPAATADAQIRLAALGNEGLAGQTDFATSGCNACHTIAISGYSGKIGPNLDGYLRSVPPAVIQQFIVDPLSVNIPGFTHDLMPNNFGTRLTGAKLDAIVAYLHAVAG